MSDIDELVKRLKEHSRYAWTPKDIPGLLSILDKQRSDAADALTAQQQEIERLREALEPFGRALSAYGTFAEHQLILLSEDNPKGRRLAHLLPEQFYTAAALTGKEGEDG